MVIALMPGFLGMILPLHLLQRISDVGLVLSLREADTVERYLMSASHSLVRVILKAVRRPT